MNFLRKARAWFTRARVRTLCALAAVMAVGAVRAEGGNDSGIDFSAATTALTDIKTAITQWINTNSTTLVAILCAFLVVSMIFLVVKWFKRGSSKA